MKGIIGGVVFGIAGALTIYGSPVASRNSVGVQTVAFIFFILAILSLFYGIYKLSQGK
jgi:hypothetical protein